MQSRQRIVVGQLVQPLLMGDAVRHIEDVHDPPAVRIGEGGHVQLGDPVVRYTCQPHAGGPRLVLQCGHHQRPFTGHDE
ncbi:hypothetical protein BH23ACT9_BH23ACT9_24550 [soil metagenome]